MYAFDQSYRQVWKRSLGSPSPAEERQCGDINPLGITGTPVYDATTNHVFLVAKHGGWCATNCMPGCRVRSCGVEHERRPTRCERPGMQQRGALAIADNRVWVSYGAQAGDCGNYKGRVVGVPLDCGSNVIFYSPPTRRGGGIWARTVQPWTPPDTCWSRPANGAVFPLDAYEHTNSAPELDANAKVIDSFAPTTGRRKTRATSASVRRGSP